MLRESDFLFNAFEERLPCCGRKYHDRPATGVLRITDPDEARAQLCHFHTVTVAGTVGTLAPCRPHGRRGNWRIFAAGVPPTHGGTTSIQPVPSTHSGRSLYLPTNGRPAFGGPSQPKEVRLQPQQGTGPAGSLLTTSPALCPRRAPFPAQTTPKTADSPHAMARCGLSRSDMIVVKPWPHKTHAAVSRYDFPRAHVGSPDTPPQEWQANERGPGGSLTHRVRPATEWPP